MTRVAAHARSKILRDDGFLIEKHTSTHRKIKFLDCVYDIPTVKTKHEFRPDERLFAHVPRAFPPRVQADVNAARVFVEDIFLLLGVATLPIAPDFDFKKIPLWQFFVMAIGAAIAGDVDVKSCTP